MNETDQDWKAHGLCRFYPPSVFFPNDAVGVEQAKVICAECPVKRDCLEYALVTNQDHGVWGGESERSRRKLRKRRRDLS